MGLGSGIRDPEKTYSGSRIQWSNRHRIPDPDPQHCFYIYYRYLYRKNFTFKECFGYIPPIPVLIKSAPRIALTGESRSGSDFGYPDQSGIHERTISLRFLGIIRCRDDCE
jgi:hypothetical protein